MSQDLAPRPAGAGIPKDIPDGPMSIHAACRWLQTQNNVLKLLATGDISGQQVHTAAGKTRIQVFGESIREYLARSEATAQ